MDRNARWTGAIRWPAVSTSTLAGCFRSLECPHSREAAGSGKNHRVALEAERGLVAGFSDKATNVFTAADGLPGFKPLVISKTGDGAVWVGYVDGSACRLAGGKVTRFGAPDGLVGTSGCWLATDVAGQLWFAKAGRVGVFRTSRFETRFTFTDRVVRVAAARDGGLWVSGHASTASSRNASVRMEGQLTALEASCNAAARWSGEFVSLIRRNVRKLASGCNGIPASLKMCAELVARTRNNGRAPGDFPSAMRLRAERKSSRAVLAATFPPRWES
jgi:hypothetical protein